MTTHDAEELWISRAIDRCASADDWRRLDARAAEDRDVWRRLAHTLRAEGLLVRGLQGVLHDGRLPAAAAAAARATMRGAAATQRARPVAAGTVVRRAAAGAAVLLALAAAFAFGRASAPAGSAAARDLSRDAVHDAAPAQAPDAPAELPDMGAERLLASYLDAGRASGRVLEQLPLRAIATERRADGRGLDVVFVRSIVERTRVDHGVRLASDEHGDPAPLPVDLAHFIPPTDF